MNLQNIMKQAQKMQSDLTKKNQEIDNKIFPGKYSLLDLELLGNKKILKLEISKELKMDEEDRELLEEAIIVAINKIMEEIDEERQKIMGDIPRVPGLF